MAFGSTSFLFGRLYISVIDSTERAKSLFTSKIGKSSSLPGLTISKKQSNFFVITSFTWSDEVSGTHPSRKKESLVLNTIPDAFFCPFQQVCGHAKSQILDNLQKKLFSSVEEISFQDP